MLEKQDLENPISVCFVLVCMDTLAILPKIRCPYILSPHPLLVLEKINKRGKRRLIVGFVVVGFFLYILDAIFSLSCVSAIIV